MVLPARYQSLRTTLLIASCEPALYPACSLGTVRGRQRAAADAHPFVDIGG
jgi:hypothetical protein